eukprot:scaffold57876_cov62-Phaeocystis_antarctica.AAC.4
MAGVRVRTGAGIRVRSVTCAPDRRGAGAGGGARGAAGGVASEAVTAGTARGGLVHLLMLTIGITPPNLAVPATASWVPR